MIDLVVEPRVSKTWEAFCQETPPYSIALDGYVIGPPAFAPTGPHANFDHHDGVDRLASRSTCMQVYLAIVFEWHVIPVYLFAFILILFQHFPVLWKHCAMM